MNFWFQWRYFLSLSGGQCGAQAGHQSGRPDTLGSRQQAELGPDVLHPAGAGECSHRYAVSPSASKSVRVSTMIYLYPDFDHMKHSHKHGETHFTLL